MRGSLTFVLELFNKRAPLRMRTGTWRNQNSKAIAEELYKEIQAFWTVDYLEKWIDHLKVQEAWEEKAKRKSFTMRIW